LAGTKSELSGKPYLVQTRDGRVVKSAEWLTQILADYRSGQQTPGNPRPDLHPLERHE
jgi:hypothetical protein